MIGCLIRTSLVLSIRGLVSVEVGVREVIFVGVLTSSGPISVEMDVTSEMILCWLIIGGLDWVL